MNVLKRQIKRPVVLHKIPETTIRRQELPEKKVALVEVGIEEKQEEIVEDVNSVKTIDIVDVKPENDVVIANEEVTTEEKPAKKTRRSKKTVKVDDGETEETNEN